MKILSLVFLLGIATLLRAQVGIGTNVPDNSAKLDVSSNDKGFLPPRLTTNERNAIVNPAAGLMIYNSTIKEIEFYNGSQWISISRIANSNLPLKKLLGTSSAEFCSDIIPTPDGGYICLGITVGSNNGTLEGLNSNGDEDIWVIKLSSAGNVEWQKLFGGGDIDEGTSIINTIDGGYAITGYSMSSNSGTFTGTTNLGNADVLFIKLDRYGLIQFHKFYGGNAFDIGYEVQQTADGGYIIGGYSGSSNNGTLAGITNNGSNDGYIIKTDATGTILWQKLIGGSSSDVFFSLKLVNDGSFIVAGNSNSSNTGNLIGVNNNGVTDAYLLRVTSTGSIQWQKLIGGASNDYATSVIQSVDNGFVFSAYTASNSTGSLTGFPNNGSLDGWVIKLDINGNFIWQKIFGGTNNDYLFSILESPDNGYIISGITNSSNSGTINMINNGLSDAWLLKLNVSGNVMWQKVYGGEGYDSNRALCLTSEGNLVFANESASSNTGSLTGLVTYGNSDIWIFTTDRFGNPR